MNLTAISGSDWVLRSTKMEEGVEAGAASFFMTIPEEIQDKIVKKLTEYKDVENVCVAFPHLYDTVGDWFEAMKLAQVTKKVFDILLRKKYLDKVDALKSRMISKTWKESVDNHYRTANVLSVMFEVDGSYVYPRAVISLPMSESFSTRLIAYTDQGGNPFVGNRLLIKFGHTNALLYPLGRLTDLVQSEQVAQVWQHAHHLEICVKAGVVYDFWDSDASVSSRDSSGSDSEDMSDLNEFENCSNSRYNRYLRRTRQYRRDMDLWLRPFLEQMQNVKTLKLSLDHAGAARTILQAMPALDRLEQFAVSSKYDRNSINYSGVLAVCRSSLKLLSGPEALITCLMVRGLSFQNLEELRHQRKNFFVLHHQNYWPNTMYSKEIIDNVFPAVKVMELNFYYHTCLKYEMFVSITHAFHALEYMVMNVINFMNMLNDKSGRWPNAPSRTCRQVRRGLKNLVFLNVVNSPGFEELVRDYARLFAPEDECKIISIPYIPVPRMPDEDDEDGQQDYEQDAE